jgi:FkbM family methyltransferase
VIAILGVVNSSQVVIFGAGNLGRRVARAVGATLFCDNNSKLWGTSIDGIPVESPSTAARLYPEATFVVAIWNPSRTETMLDRVAQLKNSGATTVIPFIELFDDYANDLLPHLLWAKRDYYDPHREEIAAGRALLDCAGREEFDRQMQLRSGRFLGQVIDSGTQYFPPEIHLGPSEVFVDCGAFDGDTVAQFRDTTRNLFQRIIAFEPDPVNLASLRKTANGDDRVSIQPYAVGARRETIRFTVAGAGSHLSQDGDCEVQVISLDEALGDETPTYIKFDIEGSELDALGGGQETIRRHRPKLAVCVYHVPNHLWRIPIKLNELLPDSKLTLRTYNADGFDCVCYCIPD